MPGAVSCCDMASYPQRLEDFQEDDRQLGFIFPELFFSALNLNLLYYGY